MWNFTHLKLCQSILTHTKQPFFVLKIVETECPGDKTNWHCCVTTCPFFLILVNADVLWCFIFYCVNVVFFLAVPNLRHMSVFQKHNMGYFALFFLMFGKDNVCLLIQTFWLRLLHGSLKKKLLNNRYALRSAQCCWVELSNWRDAGFAPMRK